MLTFHVRCVTIADISPTRPQAKMSKKQRPRRFNGALFHGLPLLVGVEQSLTGSGYEVGPDGGDPSVPSIQTKRSKLRPHRSECCEGLQLLLHNSKVDSCRYCPSRGSGTARQPSAGSCHLAGVQGAWVRVDLPPLNPSAAPPTKL